MNEFETRTQIDEDILKVYPYGSIVYGCSTEKSDSDYIVVVDSQEPIYYSVQEFDADYTVYSEASFIKRIQEHHITALECIFQTEDDPYRKYFGYDSEQLRRNISAISANSIAKCRKKMLSGEDYAGRKSIFHAIRIVMFGIQIAEYRTILDYSVANHYLKKAMELEDWEEVKSHFTPIYKNYKSEFKKLALLESEK